MAVFIVVLKPLFGLSGLQVAHVRGDEVGSVHLLVVSKNEGKLDYDGVNLGFVLNYVNIFFNYFFFILYILNRNDNFLTRCTFLSGIWLRL